MRSHQFEIDPHRSGGANLLRLRCYFRNRFGKPATTAKGRRLIRRNAKHMDTGKWKHFS